MSNPVLPLHSPTRQTRSQTSESTQFYNEPPTRSRSPRKRVQKPTTEPHDSQSGTNLSKGSLPAASITEDDPFRERSNIHRSPPSRQPGSSHLEGQVQMPPPPVPASDYNTAQNSPVGSEEDSPSRGRALRTSPPNPMSTVPALGPPQTPSRPLQPSVQETPQTVRPNASVAVEITPALNNQDNGARARAEPNAQPTQNLQSRAPSPGREGSQAIQPSRIISNPSPMDAYIADLEQKGYSSAQIAQLVSKKKGKSKETLVVEGAGANFERDAMYDDDRDSEEITEEDKQQEMDMLNSAVPPGTAIEVPPEILSIYHGICDDLKALWLNPDDPRVINELNRSNEDICNTNRRIFPNDASSQRKYQIPIQNMRFHIGHIRQIYNSMQQRSGNQQGSSTNLMGRESQILEAAKLFFIRMRELQIPVVDTMDPAIKATLMKELIRTNIQAASIDSDPVVRPENSGEMIAPPSARGVMPQQPLYFTPWGIVTGVMPAGTGSRVLVNAGTPNLPRYFLYPGAVFGKRVAKQWLTNVQLTSAMKKENSILRLWTDIARVDFVVEVMANSGDRNPIGYVHLVYKENNSQPQLRKEEWQTKSGFFNIAGKQQGKMMLRQLELADQAATRGWAVCKAANIHPETRLPLTDQQKEEMPWLTSQHYAAFQTIANDTIMHEGPQTRSQLQQPAFSTQPAFTAQQSVLAAQPPALATSQPILFTQQPVLSAQQPPLPTQQPALPTQQPVLPTQQPAAQTQPSTSATSTASITQSTRRALFSYQARSTAEASLYQGELIRFVLDRGDGWWLILKSDNTSGFAPSNYLST